MGVGNDDLEFLYAELDEILGHVRSWDKLLQQALNSVEQRVSDRTKELQKEIRKRAGVELQLRKAKEAAVLESHAKSKFLANVSHEIRTPMNGVIGMADLLLKSGLRPEQRRYADAIHASGKALLGLIGDTLDYSKIESGRLTIEETPFDLELAIVEVVELLSSTAEVKNLPILTQYAWDAPRRIIGDPGRFRQILTNLIGNAIKFTERGHVLVRTECLRKGDGAAVLRVSVEDTGIGIPEEKLPVIFQQFAQADNTTSREYGGTGLGLAISHQLMTLMKGRIGVASKVGKGSRFRITICLELDHQAPDDRTVLPERISDVHMLLVDSDATSQCVVLERFRQVSVPCEAYASVGEALRAWEELSESGSPLLPIIMLTQRALDYDTESLEAAIDGNRRLRDACFVLLTSPGECADAPEHYDLPITARFAGPMTELEFLGAVDQVRSMHLRGERAGLITRTMIAGTPGALDTQTEQPIHARVLVAEDNAINQEVAAGMLEELGCCVDLADDGEKALALSQQSDYDVIFMDCQMPNMDGYEVTRIIREIEPHGTHVPIVAVTAHAVRGDRERCLAAGMDEYLAKPISFESVRQVLNRVLNVGVATPQADSPDETAADISELPDWEKECALARLRNRSDILETIVEIFLNEAPEEVDQLEDAVLRGDLGEVEELAHALKGTAGGIGGTRVQQFAYEIEHSAREGDAERVKELYSEFRLQFARLVEALRSEESSEAVPVVTAQS